MATTRKVRTFLATGFLVANVILSASAAQAAKGEGDGRIKTLIYNDAEVFRIVMRNGFQTDVELSQDETIDTLSIGDSIGWQITPAAHRIFIKPLQRTGVTNLSVITNKHTYQFELVATNPVNNTPDHAYVVKFYYPDMENNSAQPPIDRTRGFTRPVSPTAIPEIPMEPQIPATTATPPVMPGEVNAPNPPAPLPQTAITPPPAPVTPPLMPGDMHAPPVTAAMGSEGYNFNYTLSGPEENAPVKIYDDGKSTFFQFKTQPSPALNFARILPNGSEIPLPARPDGEGKLIVDQVADKFTIRDGSSLICVFNEQPGAAPTPATPARP